MKKALLASLISAVTLAPIAAHAADGTISFNGTITAQTCTINGGAADLTVTLPTLSTSALANNQTAGITPFQINLTNCSPNSGNVSTFFELGSTVDTATNQLRNTTGAGRATNVQIRVMNEDASQIMLGRAAGAQNSAPATITNGNATLRYLTAYAANGGAATAGTVATSVRYSMQFN